MSQRGRGIWNTGSRLSWLLALVFETDRRISSRCRGWCLLSFQEAALDLWIWRIGGSRRCRANWWGDPPQSPRQRRQPLRRGRQSRFSSPPVATAENEGLRLLQDALLGTRALLDEEAGCISILIGYLSRNLSSFGFRTSWKTNVHLEKLIDASAREPTTIDLDIFSLQS